MVGMTTHSIFIKRHYQVDMMHCHVVEDKQSNKLWVPSYSGMVWKISVIQDGYVGRWDPKDSTALHQFLLTNLSLIVEVPCGEAEQAHGQAAGPQAQQGRREEHAFVVRVSDDQQRRGARARLHAATAALLPVFFWKDDDMVA